jgi:Flp pilus assembly protein TadG
MIPCRSTKLRLFRRHEGGNAAMMFGLALIPLVGFIGAALDYSRASDFQIKLHQAADAAALIAARDRTSPWGNRKANAEKAFHSALGGHDGMNDVWVKLREVDNGVRVEAGGDVVNRIMGAVGLARTPVKTFAEAITITNPTEVALVLDNTGSMKNDMDALRKAATNFTQTLFANAGNDQLRMAVVPYVAAVNPGRANLKMQWMDTGANSKWHGHHLKNKTIASMIGCDPDPDPKPVASGGGGGSSGPTNSPPSGKDRSASLWPELPSLADLALELFGIRSANAQVTPATDNLNSGEMRDPGKTPKGNAHGGSGQVPNGCQYYHPCWLRNPTKVSRFDLFDRIKGGSWKGCIEARPEPYDVTDDPPSPSNPDTLFVPYFAPDEPGKAGKNEG